MLAKYFCGIKIWFQPYVGKRWGCDGSSFFFLLVAVMASSEVFRKTNKVRSSVLEAMRTIFHSERKQQVLRRLRLCSSNHVYDGISSERLKRLFKTQAPIILPSNTHSANSDTQETNLPSDLDQTTSLCFRKHHEHFEEKSGFAQILIFHHN